ncbi:MAG: hypothetical protein JJU26_11150 [Oceanicaulis sp.]|uniref:hypothetical protein n=1 Tax=Glycocaulis sp. TaxID=1969725 RepID=UPI0025B8F7F9|nr:hypothetical protein [Glycocaulis sp.]MCC5982261.1 hypothetical protein [Oceanicaulis sp.]MCH8522137.1 hypothetical protein [Glycocaulis sp.]
MTIKFEHYTLLIDSAFRLDSSCRALDPGLYRIETDTEQMNGASFQARRCLFTTIRPIDAQGRTLPGEIYEMTAAELTQVLTCHAAALQPPNTVRQTVRHPDPLPEPDRLAIERACNEGMVARG